jgi:SAM-dependent methyltransferase
VRASRPRERAARAGRRDRDGQTRRSQPRVAAATSWASTSYRASSRSRDRATSEGLAIEFVEGDAEELPVADASFDAVVSVFGAMFAPDQERTAALLQRACRSGGTIAMANWTLDLAPFFGIVAAYAPPPPGLESPLR